MYLSLVFDPKKGKMNGKNNIIQSKISEKITIWSTVTNVVVQLKHLLYFPIIQCR